MYTLCVEDKFSAAHQLIDYNGPCENLHGHTFKVKVCVYGEKLNSLSLLIDFTDLKKILKDIRDQLDHQFLNNVLNFSPTSENLSKYFYDKVKEKLPLEVKLKEVTLWESETSSATYND